MESSPSLYEAVVHRRGLHLVRVCFVLLERGQPIPARFLPVFGFAEEYVGSGRVLPLRFVFLGSRRSIPVITHSSSVSVVACIASGRLLGLCGLFER